MLIRLTEKIFIEDQSIMSLAPHMDFLVLRVKMGDSTHSIHIEDKEEMAQAIATLETRTIFLDKLWSKPPYTRISMPKPKTSIGFMDFFRGTK
jgi:hypothetical protein